MIYLTSDLHGAFDIHKINPDEFTVGNSLCRDDFLIVCGDFGCIWDGASSDRFWLNWLESLPWTTLFLDGNHENFDVLNAYPVEEWHGGKIHRIRSNVVHLMRGEVFELDGKTFLCAGGGFSHDADARKPGVSWWNDEIFSKSEEEHCFDTLKRLDGKVDFVLSHDVYASHPCSSRYPVSMERYDAQRVDQHQFLEKLRTSADYQAWFCGHYHEDTTFIKDGKPCYMLFDTVEKLENILEHGAGKQIG